MAVQIPKFSFPVPSDKNGKAFSSAEDLLKRMEEESTGLYLVGRQGMWHGGIHFTDKTVPWCALSSNSDQEKNYRAEPYKGEQFIRCMADGEIVAWRVSKDYESDAIAWQGEKLHQSSSFVLVKHRIQPVEAEDSGLDFYTLYMHLSPFSVYGSTGNAGERKVKSAQRYYLSEEDTRACKRAGMLDAGAVVTLSDNIITRARDRRQFTQVLLTTATKRDVGDPLPAGTRVWTVSDRGALVASQTVPTPPWWSKCTPAYTTQPAGVVQCTSRTDWSVYLSKEDVLARNKSASLSAGFPLSYEPGNEEQQMVRPAREPVKTNSDQEHTFSLVTLGRNVGKLKKGDRVWVASDGDSLTPVAAGNGSGEPKFESVEIPPAPIAIKAGEGVGHMGFYELPQENGKTSRYQVHIECLSAGDVEKFLSNPEHVNEKEADLKDFISYPEGAPLYVKENDGTWKDTSRKTRTPGILTRTKVPTEPPGSSNETVKYYQIRNENGWVKAESVTLVSRYTLNKLGFLALDREAGSFDLIDGIHQPDNVVQGILEQLYKAAKAETRTQYMLNQYNYKRLLELIDSNHDGHYSQEEYLLAVHNASYREHLYRIVAKHDSEWYSGKDDPLWQAYLETLNDIPDWKTYTEAYIEKMKWMKGVSGLASKVWHMHPIIFLSAIKAEVDCAKLIWGEVVNQRLGLKKACEFRRKVLDICTELWGEENRIEYANALMACMAVETSRLFTSSVVKLMPRYGDDGNVLINKKGRIVKEYRPLTKDELIGNPSLSKRNAVGLIQFTKPAVDQINITHERSVSKQELALMDEIEQLDYVKLYFTSNKKLFDKIKNSDDIYMYIFCPAGVGQDDDFALYSRQKDIDEGVNYYSANSSLDSSLNGNSGNNDGVIQRRELLNRFNKLKSEGDKLVNNCDCNNSITANTISLTKEPSGVQWVNRYPTSRALSDLLPTFSTSVSNFIRAIENAGGNVSISATYRPEQRAYLMHYAWKIAREGMSPSVVPEKTGVNIDWTHNGNNNAAIAAARNMVAAYSIVYSPALTSRHTQRRAIDMNITNIISKTVRSADGVNVLISSMSSLHRVGLTYGVHKLISDPPHWSDDGR